MARRTVSLILGALLLCGARVARAGLRPLYGGEITLSVSAPPQTYVPSQAWSASEVVLANALGASINSVMDGLPEIGANGTVRFTVRSDATWPDGSPIDARSLAAALRSEIAAAVVSLPPLKFRAHGQVLDVEAPTAMADPMRYLDVPWLRLTKGSAGGPFRVLRHVIEADVNAIGGRGMADQLRVEVKQGRSIEPTPDGLALVQPGVDGRPVFALPRIGSPAHDALVSALSSLDRVALARYFVRTASRVPEDWPLPTSVTPAQWSSQLVLLVDASERDQRTVADRLQVFLRDRGITARLSVEERGEYFKRLSDGDYDLALVALPPAPHAIQAATLIRLASGKEAARQFWSAALSVAGDREEEALLKEAAAHLGAALLYVEQGGIVEGSRIRDANISAPWKVDLGNAWIAPPGAP